MGAEANAQEFHPAIIAAISSRSATFQAVGPRIAAWAHAAIGTPKKS
jgi:hypothetical protein